MGLLVLWGRGRTEILRAIYRADPLDKGEIRLFGKKTEIRHPSVLWAQGIGLVPGSKRQGLFLIRPVTENVTIANLKQVFRFPTLRRFGK